MYHKDFINELGRVKRNCSKVTDEECINGHCPYSTKGDRLFNCLWDDMGLNPPVDWKLPEEV